MNKSIVKAGLVILVAFLILCVIKKAGEAFRPPPEDDDDDKKDKKKKNKKKDKKKDEKEMGMVGTKWFLKELDKSYRCKKITSDSKEYKKLLKATGDENEVKKFKVCNPKPGNYKIINKVMPAEPMEPYSIKPAPHDNPLLCQTRCDKKDKCHSYIYDRKTGECAFYKRPESGKGKGDLKIKRGVTYFEKKE